MKFETERIFEHPRELIFDVLIDAGSYSAFVPFCVESKILERTETSGGERLKTRNRFRSRRFGVDLETISTVDIDRDRYLIETSPAPEDPSGFRASGMARLEALAPGRARLMFVSNSERRTMWDVLTPKRALFRMIMEKFFDIVDERATLLTEGRPQTAKETSQDENAENDPRDDLLARLPKDQVGAELGVYMGAFAERLLSTTRPRKLHLVDPWIRIEGKGYEDSWYVTHDQEHMDSLHDLVSQRFAVQVADGLVEIHRRTAAEFLQSLPDESLDWVYVDGDHSYEAVCADLSASLPKVKAGGLISGDDYRVGGWFKDNVIRAVDEFVASQPVEMTFSHHGQYILKKLER